MFLPEAPAGHSHPGRAPAVGPSESVDGEKRAARTDRVSKSSSARTNSEWIWALYAASPTADARSQLLARLADVSSPAVARRLLRNAVEARDVELVRALVGQGCRVDDDTLELPLFGHDFPFVELLLQLGATIHGICCAGTVGRPGPWLFEAVARDDVVLARYLLELGVDVNREYDDDTALLIAASTNRPQMVRLLIEAGADRSVSRWQGTAAQIARSKGFDEVLEALDDAAIPTPRASLARRT